MENRKQRRMKKALHRRAQVVHQHPITESVLSVRVTALEESIEKMSKIIGFNNTGVSRAFSMTDQHILVLQRVANDMFLGTVKTQPKKSEEDLEVVDFNWYHNQFYQSVQLEQLMKFLQKILSIEVESTEEEPMIVEFGGDYAEDTQGNPAG